MFSDIARMLRDVRREILRVSGDPTDSEAMFGIALLKLPVQINQYTLIDARKPHNAWHSITKKNAYAASQFPLRRRCQRRIIDYSDCMR